VADRCNGSTLTFVKGAHHPVEVDDFGKPGAVNARLRPGEAYVAAP
jgi:hypothetical protein